MVEALKTYNSVEEIARSLDKEIADTKSRLGEYLRQLDELRTLAEKSKKIRETVMKLAGKKNGYSNESMGEIDVGGLKIVLDANPVQHVAIIESAVKSHQERLMVLQKARENLKPLDQLGDLAGLNFIVLENQGIPERALLKTS